MINVNKRKIYSEPDEGYSVNSIIAYKKIPHEVKKFPDGYLKSFTSSDRFWNNNYISSYKKMLFIDLWLFTINFEWITKEIMPE
jgi:hypothetical protein